MKKFRILMFILIIVQTTFGQGKKDGQVRLILTNPIEILSHGNNNNLDSCFMYVYNGDQIVKTINISELLEKNENLDERLFHDFYIKKGTYYAIIENLYNYPILITNLEVWKKKISFLPIEFSKTKKIRNSKHSIIILDFKKIFNEYMNKTMNY